jgi:hypothetical protein
MEWAEVSKDVMAFHNNKGGIIIFGIDEGFAFTGVHERIDSKLFNDKIRRYVGDAFWVEYYRVFIQPDQSYVGLAVIPPRNNLIRRFQSNSPEHKGKSLFKKVILLFATMILQLSWISDKPLNMSLAPHLL